MIVALSQSDLNTFAFLAMAFMGIFFIPRYFRASAAKAREDQLNRTVDAYKERVESQDGQMKALRSHVTDLEEQVRECHATAGKWEARYHEQSKYTAQEALDAVRAELVATRTGVVTAVGSLSELMMQVLARIESSTPPME